MESLNNGEVVSGSGNYPSADPIVEEVEAAVSEVRHGRPKRGRKRKIPTRIPNQSRADRKRLLNNNMEHINRKGKLVGSKVFDEKFVCTCPTKCTNNVVMELRKIFFLNL